jgi:hypothetical protein
MRLRRPDGALRGNGSVTFLFARVVRLNLISNVVRSVKHLSERLSNIEQYLRTASNPDRAGHIGPRFKEIRDSSVDIPDNAKCNLCQASLTISRPTAD